MEGAASKLYQTPLKTMLKKVLFAVVATGFVAALALPVQFTAAEADVQGCRQDGFPKRQGKSRRAFKKECKAAWKASHS